MIAPRVPEKCLVTRSAVGSQKRVQKLLPQRLPNDSLLLEEKRLVDVPKQGINFLKLIEKDLQLSFG